MKDNRLHKISILRSDSNSVKDNLAVYILLSHVMKYNDNNLVNFIYDRFCSLLKHMVFLFMRVRKVATIAKNKNNNRSR